MKTLCSKKLLLTLLSLLLAVIMAGACCVPALAELAETEPTTDVTVPNEDTEENEESLPDGEPIPDEEEEPTVTYDLDVIARTLQLNENVFVRYAVPASEEEVKMLFFTEAQEEYTVENAACTADPIGVEEVLGQPAMIFEYTALADKQMTDVLYARAYVETADGTVYGEVNKYSILQYAYNKLEAEDTDPELEETLRALLDRGAEAQLEEDYKTDDLANEPHSQVHVVEDVMEDGFADFLNPDSKEIENIERYMITTDGATFYLEFDVVITGYTLIEDYMYYFEELLGAKKDTVYDYHEFDKKGRIVADLEFVTLDTDTYYFIGQQVVYGYQLINDLLYYFGTTGVMAVNTTIDGYEVNGEGVFVGSEIFVDTGDNVYYLVDNIVIYIYIYIDCELYLELDGMLYPTTDYESTVLESDSDENAENNDALGGVTCTATIVELDITFTVISDENGHFAFPKLPKLEIIFIFSYEGFITGEVTMDLADEDAVLLPSIILDKNVSNNLSGKVTIADTDTNYSNNASLAGATVKLERLSSLNALILTTTTDAVGNYSFGELTVGVYRLTVIINGYITVTQIVNIRENQSSVQNAVIEAIPDTGDATGTASGTLKDARTGYAISGVKLIIRAGLNNTTGAIIATVTTNSNGYYSVADLPAGNYTAQVLDDRALANEDLRFASITIAIKIIGGVTITEQNVTTSNNVGLDVNSIRVVLTWGSSPRDLDSYTYIYFGGSLYEQVYYSNKEGDYADLDVDDTSAYGPETTTINTSRDGIYKFVVHNYTDRGYSYSTTLANSGAKVTIYFGGNVPAYELYVPQGAGTHWNVFTYNSTTGEFIIHNTITA